MQKYVFDELNEQAKLRLKEAKEKVWQHFKKEINDGVQPLYAKMISEAVARNSVSVSLSTNSYYDNSSSHNLYVNITEEIQPRQNERKQAIEEFITEHYKPRINKYLDKLDIQYNKWKTDLFTKTTNVVPNIPIFDVKIEE